MFVTGLEDGLFPHENSLSEYDGIEEERRLAYVAITRARRRLYLTHAQSRMLHGQLRYNVASRFLDELSVGEAKRQAADPSGEQGGTVTVAATGDDGALATILDSNITTFIAAAVLFFIGTGPVRGFAVTLGIGMSVPIVVWGSGVLAGLMNRYPWIIWAGGGLLGYVAGDMLLEDPLVVDRLGAVGPALEYPVPGALAAVLTGVGWWMARPKRA